MGHIKSSYQPAMYSPMRTDLYELNMTDAFNGMGRGEDKASFYFHWRKPAFSKNGEGFTTSIGTEALLDFFDNYKFTKDNIAFLKTLKGTDGKPRLSTATLDKLENSSLKLSVYGMPEGTPVTGPYADIRVDGPLDQCLIAEAMMMLLSNQPSKVATRASRLTEASGGRPVADMGLRRSTGLGLETARAAFIGGTSGLADVGAAEQLGLGDKLVGTMAHLWVQSHVRDGITNSQAEFEAFCNWLTQKPGSAVLLVDTFDIKQGVDNAIAAAKKTGVALAGIRIDTGNKEELLKWANYIDDRLELEAKNERDAKQEPKLFDKTGIFITNDLDENSIDWMRRTSLAERGKWSERMRFGVGTALDNPGPNGGVYKMTSYETKVSKDGVATQFAEAPEFITIRTMKVAGVDRSNPARPKPGIKSSLPAVELNSVRMRDKDGKILGDIIVDTAFWDKKLSTEENLKHSGFFIQAGGHEEVQLPQFASAELMLHQLYDKGKKVYAWPYKGAAEKPAYDGGPNVTNLEAIQAYATQQRSQLPENVRRIEGAERLPLFIDPRIVREQMKIIEKMSEIPAEVKTAHIDVDIDRQNGFSKPTLTALEGGNLYVPGAEKVAPKAGEMLAQTSDGIILLSQDYHPSSHISFMTNHPGVMEYRRAQVSDPADAMNPLKLPFNEMVQDESGRIIGLKEGEGDAARIRKVIIASRDNPLLFEGAGFEPSEKDRGRIMKVTDEYEAKTFEEMKKANPGIHTQMLWTPHCIQGTKSADFVDDLGLPDGLKQKLAADSKSSHLSYKDDRGNTYHVIRKGTNPELDSYGIGLENDRFTRTALPQVLRAIVTDLQKQGYKKAVFNFKGLATNFCVEHSHNNIRALLSEEFFKFSGIQFEGNFLGDQSAAIPIPGGAKDPYSARGAPERMHAFNPAEPTQIRSTDTILRERRPTSVVSGKMMVSGAREQAQGIGG